MQPSESRTELLKVSRNAAARSRSNPKHMKRTGTARAIHPVDIHAGARVLHLRKRAGITRNRFAEAAGLTAQQLQKYENGQNRMSAGRLWDFARILGLPVSDFFVGLPGAAVPVPSSTPELDALTAVIGEGDGVDLVEALPELEPILVKRLASLARVLADTRPPEPEVAEADASEPISPTSTANVPYTPKPLPAPPRR